MKGIEGVPVQKPKDIENEEQEVLSRRNFLKKSGAAAASVVLGAVALGTPEEAEARRREKGSEKNIEYSGFRPNNHQRVLIETRLKNMAPDALSSEVALVKNSRESAFLRISVLLKEGKQVEVVSQPFQQRREENLTPALNETLNELERKLSPEPPKQTPPSHSPDRLET